MATVGVDPSKLPALAPPDGVTSNFVDPIDRGPSYIATTAVFLAIAICFVIMRLWVRFKIQRSPWWDDLVSILALLCQSSYCGINIWLCLNGVGRHMWDVHASDALRIIPPAKVMADLTQPAIGFTKLALLLFYYRLFHPDNGTRIGSLVGMAFVIPFYTILLFCFIFIETQKLYTVNQVTAIINIFSDFYVLILPLPAVIQLKLAKKKKLGLYGVFSTGLLACTMSIIGAVYRFRWARDYADFTWGLLDVILVNTIECCVGIVCMCLPFLPAASSSVFARSGHFGSMRSLCQRIINSRPSASGISTPRGNSKPDSVEMGGRYDIGKGDSTQSLAQHHPPVLNTFCGNDLMPDSYRNPTINTGAYAPLVGAMAHPNDSSRVHTHPNGIEFRRDFSIARTERPPQRSKRDG